MKRREFITLLGGAAAVWPLGAGAAVSDAGDRVLSGSALADPRYLPVFRQGIRETGFVEGQNAGSSIAGRRNNTTDCPSETKDPVRKVGIGQHGNAHGSRLQLMPRPRCYRSPFWYVPMSSALASTWPCIARSIWDFVAPFRSSVISSA
jgi:hypothetical protein